jgi:hypothetical protein
LIFSPAKWRTTIFENGSGSAAGQGWKGSLPRIKILGQLPQRIPGWAAGADLHSPIATAINNFGMTDFVPVATKNVWCKTGRYVKTVTEPGWVLLANKQRTNQMFPWSTAFKMSDHAAAREGDSRRHGSKLAVEGIKS